MDKNFTKALDRLTHMRKHLRPQWISMEWGGVFLFVGANRADYWNFLKDFYNIPEVKKETSDDKKNYVIAEILSDDVRTFFEIAYLPIGMYELDNYHQEYADNGIIKFNAYCMASYQPYEWPDTSTFMFSFTEEHLKLMDVMHTRDWEGYIEVIDAKRPYGDMSHDAVYFDMAFALGEGPSPTETDVNQNLPKEQTKRYDRLHQEMLFAVQAFWRYAKIENHNAPNRMNRIVTGFIRETEAQGWAKGVIAGEAKGMITGKAETLLKLLAHRFGGLSEDLEQRVREADAETLDCWALRVLDAKSIKDVIAN